MKAASDILRLNIHLEQKETAIPLRKPALSSLQDNTHQMKIAACLVRPALTNFGKKKPQEAGDGVYGK